MTEVSEEPGQVVPMRPIEINEEAFLDKYNPTARQRFEFVVTDGGAKFDTAHVFEPIGDDRWLKFLKDKQVRGDAKSYESTEGEAIAALWDDLIVTVENVDLEDGATLQTAVDFAEKRDAIQHYVAVAVFDPEVVSTGKRRLGGVRTRTVLTEAHFNGLILQQTHELRAVTLEDVKKYESLLRRRFKQENVRGLRREAKVLFVSQDDKFAKLYDDLRVKTTGFEQDAVPIRFKVAVVHHIFASDLDEKKS